MTTLAAAADDGPGRCYTRKAAAAALLCHIDTIDKNIRQGRLKGWRINGQVVVWVSDAAVKARWDSGNPGKWP
jgi:hypothetical protein